MEYKNKPTQRYLLGEEVYFLSLNKVTTGIITEVSSDPYFTSDKVQMGFHSTNYRITIKKINSVGTPEAIRLSEDLIFRTKEELIESL